MSPQAPERRLRADLAGLARLTQRAGRLLSAPDEALQAAPVRGTRWSPAEHLFHLLLADELSLKNAAALAARRGALIRPFQARAELTSAILARGRIPRGRAEAPRFVRPPVRVDLAFTRELVASTLGQIAELEERVPAVLDAPNCIPHQLLGDLDAGEWVRFARVHAAHHLAILRDVTRD